MPIRAGYARRRQYGQRAAKITGHLQNNFALTSDAGLPPALIAQALQQLSTQFDAERGGFGEAPKFPPSMTIEFLLRVFLRNGDAFALHMAELTLEDGSRWHV